MQEEDPGWWRGATADGKVCRVARCPLRASASCLTRSLLFTPFPTQIGTVLLLMLRVVVLTDQMGIFPANYVQLL